MGSAQWGKQESQILNSQGSLAHPIPVTSSHKSWAHPSSQEAKKPLQPLPQREKLEMLGGPELGEVPVMEMEQPGNCCQEDSQEFVLRGP